MSLAIICIVLTVGSIEYLTILESQKNTPLFYALFPIGFILILSCVAEVGRPPFDLMEAESELVSGHKTEYSGVAFAFFFLAEYSMMLFKGIFITVLLFGLINPLPFIFLLYWLRASLPRIRIDHILSMGWSSLLPFLTGYILFLPPLLLLLDVLA
jgi:NADH-quinone oxidoreductase subunit H